MSHARVDRTFTVRNMTVTIDDWEYHRNGVSGEPFYVVRFRWNEDGLSPEMEKRERRFIATIGADDIEMSDEGLPSGPKKRINPSCRVIAEDMLGRNEDGTLEHSLVTNRWRGDHFYEVLVAGLVALAEEQERINSLVG